MDVFSKIWLGNMTGVKSRKGFSLIELMLVMGVMALIASFSMVAMNGIGRGSKVQHAVVQLSTLLTQARSLAIARNTYLYVFLKESQDGSKVEVLAVTSRTGRDVYAERATSSLDLGSTPDLELAHRKITLEQVNLALPTGRGAVPRPANAIELTRDYSLVWQGQTFDQAVVFRPSGQAAVPKGKSLGHFRALEFAIGPSFAASGTPESLVSVFQINGATGQTKIYRAQ